MIVAVEVLNPVWVLVAVEVVVEVLTVPVIVMVEVEVLTDVLVIVEVDVLTGVLVLVIVAVEVELLVAVAVAGVKGQKLMSSKYTLGEVPLAAVKSKPTSFIWVQSKAPPDCTVEKLAVGTTTFTHWPTAGT